jgi:hypothetical protein
LKAFSAAGRTTRKENLRDANELLQNAVYSKALIISSFDWYAASTAKWPLMDTTQESRANENKINKKLRIINFQVN